MDDLIVVILTLVVAGVGLLSQLKKKKQKQNPVQNNKQNTLESLWDLMQGEPNLSGQIEGAGVEETEFVDESEYEVQHSGIEYKRTAYQSLAKNRAQSKKVDKEKYEIKNSRLKSKLKKDFSLRKAVIYSEILNRKYS